MRRSPLASTSARGPWPATWATSSASSRCAIEQKRRLSRSATSLRTRRLAEGAAKKISISSDPYQRPYCHARLLGINQEGDANGTYRRRGRRGSGPVGQSGTSIRRILASTGGGRVRLACRSAEPPRLGRPASARDDPPAHDDGTTRTRERGDGVLHHGFGRQGRPLG